VAGLFVYVPTPDRVCRGNATRALLLAPCGYFQAPKMLSPGELAREQGACVFAGASADSSGGRLRVRAHARSCGLESIHETSAGPAPYIHLGSSKQNQAAAPHTSRRRKAPWGPESTHITSYGGVHQPAGSNCNAITGSAIRCLALPVPSVAGQTGAANPGPPNAGNTQGGQRVHYAKSHYSDMRDELRWCP